MKTHKFTFDYSGDKLQIHHNEAPRFVGVIHPDGDRSNIDIIEWKDKRPIVAHKLPSLMRLAGEAYVQHEKTIQRDIRRAMEDLNDTPTK